MREFSVAPPDPRKTWLLLGPVLGAALAGMALAAREEPRTWFALPVLLAAVALVLASVRRRRVLLRDGELVVHAGLHSCRVPLDALDLEHARVVDLDEHTALRPALKTFGTAVPGYRAGHFRLRDRGRAFVLLTRSTRAVVVPERTGRRLLLGVARPQALLDALRSHVR